MQPKGGGAGGLAASSQVAPATGAAATASAVGGGGAAGTAGGGKAKGTKPPATAHKPGHFHSSPLQSLQPLLSFQHTPPFSPHILPLLPALTRPVGAAARPKKMLKADVLSPPPLILAQHTLFSPTFSPPPSSPPPHSLPSVPLCPPSLTPPGGAAGAAAWRPKKMPAGPLVAPHPFTPLPALTPQDVRRICPLPPRSPPTPCPPLPPFTRPHAPRRSSKRGGSGEAKLKKMSSD
ncbi:unnamed protein product [Closterium sp. NIES-65]|nr:unnamed protein product [Closterium sp. NIES-65]